MPAKPVPAEAGSGYPVFKTTFYDFINIDSLVKSPKIGNFQISHIIISIGYEIEI